MYIIVNVCVCVARGGGIKLSYETGSTTRLNLKTFLYWVIQLGERGLEFFYVKNCIQWYTSSTTRTFIDWNGKKFVI